MRWLALTGSLLIGITSSGCGDKGEIIDPTKPWTGCWYSDIIDERTPQAMERAGELVIYADGDYSVTRTSRLLETYKDYWGTWRVDLSTSTINLIIEGGNDIPPHFDGVGTFKTSQGSLVIKDALLFCWEETACEAEEHSFHICGT